MYLISECLLLLMEIEGREEHKQEIRQPPSHDSLGNSSRPKMPTPTRVDHLPRKPRYRDCLKNHAAAIGGHAVDGCREFLPAGAEGTIDALNCAACNCHRNFHRKEADTVAVAGGESLILTPPHQRFSPYYGTPSEYRQILPAQRALGLRPSTGGRGGSHSREEEQEEMPNPGGGGGPGMSSRKRVRTKFSQEQKEKMLGLAERLEWRIQKQDEAVIHHFCNEAGVKRHVFKVWMHNNKHTLGKKP